MIFIQLVTVVALIYTVIFMSNTLKKSIYDSPLSSNEKLVVSITCFLNPVIAGIVYYYGWKKQLPTKAKQANTISFLALLVCVILFAAYILYHGSQA